MLCENCMKRRTFFSRALAFPAAIAAMVFGIETRSAGAKSYLRKSPRPAISADEVKKLIPGKPKHFLKSEAWIILKDDKTLVAFDQRCQHKGCTYAWNAKSKRFECPCHGSQYNVTGKVLQGPTTKPLVKLKIEKTKDGAIKLIDQ